MSAVNTSAAVATVPPLTTTSNVVIHRAPG
jgi:hypothetical protein